ncbi:hypothetical protein C4569_00955 [Candidatus Parcubacteria bacterium]|nr:MAG: hypothetical protein C4569_00955 [Candidatus Parcubacteria bacterium]
MAKCDYYKLDPEERKKLLYRFYTAVTALTSYDEVENFFKDLFTVQEITMFSRRLKIAELLETGKTYDYIADNLRVGKDTIAGVQKWLEYGREGYKKAIEKLKDVDNVSERKKIKNQKQKEAFSFEWLKKRYSAIDSDDVKDLVFNIKKNISKQKRKKSLR